MSLFSVAAWCRSAILAFPNALGVFGPPPKNRVFWGGVPGGGVSPPDWPPIGKGGRR